MERAGKRFVIKKESEEKRLEGYGEVPQPVSEQATSKTELEAKA